MEWAGICVEASPAFFKKLKMNRPSCSNWNNLIGDNEGEEGKFFTFLKESWEGGLSCMEGTSCGKDQQAAEKYAAKHSASLQVENVRFLKLSTIFRHVGMSNIGWISVDVEGAEDFVIPTIDFAVTRSDFFSYENDHKLSRDILESHGYVHILQSGQDHVFKGPVG